jgi:hypothetical protein
LDDSKVRTWNDIYNFYSKEVTKFNKEEMSVIVLNNQSKKYDLSQTQKEILADLIKFYFQRTF